MRTIIGKVGKSRVLEKEMARFKKEESLLIDMVGVHSIRSLASYLVVPNSFAELIATFEELERDSHWAKIKNVILELNTRIEDISIFLEWEERLKKQFVLTVQDDETDKILVVDMSLPY